MPLRHKLSDFIRKNTKKGEEDEALLEKEGRRIFPVYFVSKTDRTVSEDAIRERRQGWKMKVPLVQVASLLSFYLMNLSTQSKQTESFESIMFVIEYSCTEYISE